MFLLEPPFLSKMEGVTGLSHGWMEKQSLSELMGIDPRNRSILLENPEGLSN